MILSKAIEMAPVKTFDAVLPSGITLGCRAAGRSGQPVLVFLHGFPEAAFVFDELLVRFAERYRCIAPNLRGYANSSSPSQVEAYRPEHLVDDIVALIDQQASGRVEGLIAHDWGGVVAWHLAARRPELLKHLIIINSPHPAVFHRELARNPRQRAASAYMDFLCRPDAERLLAEDDYRRLWPFFTAMGAADPSQPGGGWLTDSVRSRYRDVWRQGLTGGCNFYRASPLRPSVVDGSTTHLGVGSADLTIKVPTLVVWGERDAALPVELLDGLEHHVQDLCVRRVPEATHWIVHERPVDVGDEIARELLR